jgi:hypothetical protein
MPVVRMEIVDVDQIPKGSVQRLVDAAQTYRPVFVEVQRRGRSKTTEAEAVGIAAVVAAILDRDRDNVHITFSEPLVGRIAFGGYSNEWGSVR